MKRVLDLLFTIAFIPPALVVAVAVSLAIRLEDGGPVLFKQDRLGKHGTSYTIYKFRSMSVDSKVVLSADGSTVTRSDDPRVTKVGRFIRGTSIDEFPQILNVIRGDMSWVGPRPSLVSARSTYKDDELPKFEVLPGITGYTQAYYRNSISNREKRKLDAWYARNRTLALDGKIMARTISTVLGRSNLISNE